MRMRLLATSATWFSFCSRAASNSARSRGRNVADAERARLLSFQDSLSFSASLSCFEITLSYLDSKSLLTLTFLALNSLSSAASFASRNSVAWLFLSTICQYFFSVSACVALMCSATLCLHFIFFSRIASLLDCLCPARCCSSSCLFACFSSMSSCMFSLLLTWLCSNLACRSEASTIFTEFVSIDAVWSSLIFCRVFATRSSAFCKVCRNSSACS
mmetsp:Transcript_58286/g.103516  ORF Transcript_58286/g.103516 Transcript_58286/m.103516 type:complete len:216 (-) Transcript_58286:618-1265(-)